MTTIAKKTSPLFKIPVTDINDFEAEWDVPFFTFDEDCLILGSETWLGPDDLSGTVKLAWNDDGVLLRAQIRDDDVVNDNPHGSLYARDAIEFFIATEDYTRFACGPTLLLVLAAPQADGTVRYDSYSQDKADTDSFLATAGRRVPGGYEMQLLLKWGLFGMDIAAAKKHGFRFALHIDDWDSRDDPNTQNQPRAMSINGLFYFGKPALWYPFNLEAEKRSDRDYNMSPYYHPLAIPKLVCDGTLNFSTPFPVQFDIYDAESGAQLATLPESTQATFSCQPSVKRLDILTRVPNDWGIRGYLSYSVMNISGLLQEITPLLNDTSKQDIQAQALGVLSSIEFLKYQNDDTELAWRLKRLAGNDVSDAPNMLRFLNLMGNSDGMAAVEFARNNNDKATVTITWGTLPISYTTLLQFANDNDAATFVSKQLAFKRRIDQKQLAGFDELWLSRGHRFNDALPWDLDTEHLVTVTSGRDPNRAIRFLPEDALALSPIGYVVHDGAPEAMVAIMKQAGLKQLDVAEAVKEYGHVVHVGTGNLNSTSSGYKYFHSCNGVETEIVHARIGKLVITAAGNILENTFELLEAIRDNRPITRAEVERWRTRLLESLGGDSPESRADGRMLHSGEVHAHTNYSDGTGTPGGMLFEAAITGMDFLTITDHGTTIGAERLSKALQKAGCGYPVIIGEEITLSKAYHINFMPLTSCIQYNQTYNAYVDEAKRQGAVGMLCHPMTYGTNLKKFWYGDFKGTGLDAIERRIEYIDKWRKLGTAPVVLGSTDTHQGIFGHLERSVILTENPTPASFASAVRNRLAGMLAPDLAEYIVADERVTKAVRAALADNELPALHSKRIADAFAKTDFITLIKEAPAGDGAKPKYGDGIPNETIIPYK
ncbi:MAG: hypothetical protein IJS15_05220 [Victivallales bacterium]|nr:hypothetical protein [Victivallales bacterium]